MGDHVRGGISIGMFPIIIDGVLSLVFAVMILRCRDIVQSRFLSGQQGDSLTDQSNEVALGIISRIVSSRVVELLDWFFN